MKPVFSKSDNVALNWQFLVYCVRHLSVYGRVLRVIMWKDRSLEKSVWVGVDSLRNQDLPKQFGHLNLFLMCINTRPSHLAPYFASMFGRINRREVQLRFWTLMIAFGNGVTALIIFTIFTFVLEVSIRYVKRQWKVTDNEYRLQNCLHCRSFTS